MLDTIRRAQPAVIKSVLVVVVGAFVATIFIDWGWRRSGRSDPYLARVGDEVVSVRAYQLTYQRIVESYRRDLQDRFTEELARRLNLKQMALESLVEHKLLLYEAKRQRLTVTDAQLVERVQSDPAFQVNGTFNRNLYIQRLRGSRLTPGDYERSLREELLLAKLKYLITDGIQVTETESRDAFLREKEQVSVEYLPVEPARFVNQVEVSEVEVTAYYQEHQERFRQPERVRVAYLVIDPQSFIQGVEVTDERLAQYYEAHREEFRRDQQVHARHILFRLSPQASQDEAARVRTEAAAVLKRIQAGEDFAALAKEFSEDPGSAQHGGDLGFFKRGAMLKPFEDAAFGLKPGEVSDLVRTDFGYHIITGEGVREAGYPPLTEVREQVGERLLREEAQRVAEAKATTVYEALATGGGLWEEVARTVDVHPRETPFVARSDTVEGIENSSTFTQTAFALQIDEVSRPTLVGSHYAIIKLLERKASGVPPFEEVREAVREALTRERATALARRKADDLLAAVKGGTSLDDLAPACTPRSSRPASFRGAAPFRNWGAPGIS